MNPIGGSGAISGTNSADERPGLAYTVRALFDHIRNATLCVTVLLTAIWAGTTRTLQRSSDPTLHIFFLSTASVILLLGLTLTLLNFLDGWKKVDEWKLSELSAAFVRSAYATVYLSALAILFAHALSRLQQGN